MRIKIFFAAIVVLLVSACNKEPNFNYPEGTVGISKITYFPVFHITGNNVVSIVKGTTFTDPGVTATEGTATIPVTTTGSVDGNTVGIYFLTYTATNKDGFVSTAQRTVVVIPSAETPGLDISGTYTPIGGAPSDAIVTKEAPGVYYTTNCWGGGSLAVIPAYFICTDGATVSIPLQNGPAGHILTPSPGTYVGGLITWTVTRLDFAGGPLTRTKQWQKQ